MNRCLCAQALAALLAIGFATSNAFAEQSLHEAEQQAIRDAIATAGESVVQLQIIGGPDRLDGISLASGPATGVILTSDGLVVTSSYRFKPTPASAVAVLSDGSKYAAEMVATDFSRKLVLLQLIDATNLPEAEVAPSDSIRVGQWAIALGKTFHADQPNVSVGILSATNRIYGRAVQTDAAISAANYGGPLIDIRGRVMGIISPLSPSSENAIAGVEWYDSGIGFAVPLDTWRAALERLREGEDLQLGYLGVGLGEGTPRETPALVDSVVPGGPAAIAGMEPGDVITEIAGKKIKSQVDLKFATKPYYAGDTLSVFYLRDGYEGKAEIELATIATLEATAQEASESTDTSADGVTESADAPNE